MTSNKFIAVGKLGKPHGIGGAFRFSLYRELKSKKKTPKHFMIDAGGSYLPWFVQELNWLGFADGTILFEDIQSPEKAKQFAGRELFLEEKDADKFLKKAVDDYDFLEGFVVFDESKGEIGTVQSMDDSPGQILLTIKSAQGEVLIPLVEDFIVELDKRKKKIVLNLPDGLL